MAGMQQRFDYNGHRLLVCYDLLSGVTMLTPEGMYTSSFNVSSMPYNTWHQINQWIEKTHSALTLMEGHHDNGNGNSAGEGCSEGSSG